MIRILGLIYNISLYAGLCFGVSIRIVSYFDTNVYPQNIIQYHAMENWRKLKS